MKDNMLSYEYKPDSINNVVPAPRYSPKALNSHEEILRDSKFNLERKRTATITKR